MHGPAQALPTRNCPVGVSTPFLPSPPSSLVGKMDVGFTPVSTLASRACKAFLSPKDQCPTWGFACAGSEPAFFGDTHTADRQQGTAETRIHCRQSMDGVSSGCFPLALQLRDTPQKPTLGFTAQDKHVAELKDWKTSSFLRGAGGGRQRAEGSVQVYLTLESLHVSECQRLVL